MSLNWNGKISLAEADAKSDKLPHPKYGNDPVYKTAYKGIKGNNK